MSWHAHRIRCGPALEAAGVLLYRRERPGPEPRLRPPGRRHFLFPSLLIREPSASRPFAEPRSRPFRACLCPDRPPIPVHYQSDLPRHPWRGIGRIPAVRPCSRRRPIQPGALLRSGSHTPEGVQRRLQEFVWNNS